MSLDKKLITDLGVMQGSEESIPLYYDNYEVITQMRELEYHQKCSEKIPTY